MPRSLMTRSRRAAITAAMMTLVSACTTFEPISPRVGLSQSTLEVQFATPIRLVGRTRDGEQVVRRDVLRVAGRPLEVRNDSLVLEVARWQGFFFWRHEFRPFIAVLPTSDTCTNLGWRRFSRGRTAALILGPPVAAWVLLLILCQYQPCFFT
jgi:hypothetical protein